MAVYPSSFALEVGLQPSGSFRELLINESFVQGVWPLSELADERARDISGNRYHGTYAGGFTRGATVDLPEGALGCTFGGDGWVMVPHAADLSLAAGSVDVVFMMKTGFSDANSRFIVHKYDGTTNGYYVSLVSGAIRFVGVRSGGTVFSFDRGSVADNAWHLVHCCYEPEEERARIFIDGVQSGATVTGVTDELLDNSADFYICGKAGAASTDRYNGSLAYVMVGREGNPNISVALQAVRTWTDIKTDVRGSVEPIQWRRGIPSSSILDTMGSPGRMTFSLDNSYANTAASIGRYSPSHGNALAGFRIGIPVRLSFAYSGTTYYQFRGHITSILPAPGLYRDRYVSVTCSDWLDMAARIFIGTVEAQVGERSDQVLKMALDQVEGRTPAAVEIDTGSSIFPYALDAGEQDTVLTELSRISSSERGFCYVKGDTSQGGTLVAQGRGYRQTITSVHGSFANTMSGLDVEYSLGSVYNIVRVTFTPRSADAAATTVLYRLEASQQSYAIAPGETARFHGRYRDPNNRDVSVGGTDMVAPVAYVDYALWSQSDGSGSDLTGAASVTSTVGGTEFGVEILNTGSQTAYLKLNSTTAFQIRGRGIYHYTPATVERRNEASIRRHGPRAVQIALAYESDRGMAESVADFILGVLASQRPIPASMTLACNASTTLMANGLALDLGSKVYVEEYMTGIGQSGQGFFINEVVGTYALGNVLTMRWTLAPSAPSGAGVYDTGTYDNAIFAY